MRTPQSGYHLLESILVLAILGALLTLALPSIMEATSTLRLRLATAELTGVLRTSRAYAMRHSAKVAVKFRTDPIDGSVTFALYRDGDGDGVLNRDIDSGVDPQAGPARRLSHLGRHVGFGFPPGTHPREPGGSRRRLDRLHDPIRFNRSDLASFSPLGGSTPGSLYLTDGKRGLAVVRITNRTGKVTVLFYDVETETWKP